MKQTIQSSPLPDDFQPRYFWKRNAPSSSDAGLGVRQISWHTSAFEAEAASGERTRRTAPCAQSDLDCIEVGKSFSILVRLKIDGKHVGAGFSNCDGIGAFTALGQEAPDHSPFFLGIRRINGPLDPTSQYRWSFMISPQVTSENGGPECVTVIGRSDIDATELDRWITLVATCCTQSRKIGLFVSGENSASYEPVPESWPIWESKGKLLLHHGLWDEAPVDLWPGIVDEVQVFDCALPRQAALSKLS